MTPPSRFLTPPAHTPPADGVDLDLLRFVHRGPDGFIPLARKQGDVWQPLGALPLDAPFLPGLGDTLAADAYHGLNSDFRVARSHERPIARITSREVYKQAVIEGQRVEVLKTVPVVHREPASPATGLAHFRHTNETIRWLNCCFVDLDCYRLGLDVGQALGGMVALQDEGIIPPATMFARSGRGVWAFWLLVDSLNPTEGVAMVHSVPHTPNTPQRATESMRRTFGVVQSQLADRLRHLGADLQALDAARFAPIPGTVKTRPGMPDARVAYWLQGLANGQCPAYTLPDLAAALRVTRPRPGRSGVWVSDPAIARSKTPEADKNPELQARGQRGWLARWRGDLKDFQTIVEMRGGGFRQGQRNRGAWLLVLLSRRAGVAESDMVTALENYAAACTPPLPSTEWRQALKQKRKQRVGMLSRNGWHKQIEVTPQEASYLLHPPPAPAPGAAERVSPDRRRELVQLLHTKNPSWSARTIAAELARLGIPGNHCTVASDFRRLGLRSTGYRGGRPRNRPLLDLTTSTDGQT